MRICMGQKHLCKMRAYAKTSTADYCTSPPWIKIIVYLCGIE